MVKVYGLDIGKMTDPKEEEALLEKLSAKRQRRVLACSQLKGRREMTGAGLLLSAVLEKQGFSEEELVYGSNGKPLVPTKDNSKEFHFNLSHSGEMVLMAVSSKEVGCDVEQWENEKQGATLMEQLDRVSQEAVPGEEEHTLEAVPIEENALSRRHQKIAQRFFTEKEQKAVDEGGKKAFYRIWTRKESYIKMTGEGMKVPFLSLDTCPVSLDSKKIAQQGELQPCFFQEYDLPGYQIAICAQEKEFPEEISFLDLEELF